jgi:RND family efflux transporter MFP subunit
MRGDRRAWLLVLAGACHAAPTGEPAATRKTVRCEQVTLARVADAIDLAGAIAPLPDRDALVAPQVGGRVVRVLVREGDAVADGQVVAQIDAALLGDQARETEAALARARAERTNADATLARAQRVFEHGIAARQEVDDATARAASARAAEAEADAVAQRNRRQVERATVRSPMAGVVLKVFRRPGELVDGTPATPVVEIADPSRLELVASAPAADVVRLRAGQPATIAVAALPGSAWTGEVAVVSPAVDRATGLGTVRVSLAPSDAPRPPVGVLGSARVVAGEARLAAAVPPAALRGSGGQTEVVVCGADGVAHVRAIRRGADAGDRVEVEGVTPADSVVVDPVLGVADGEAIEVAR